MTEAAVSSLMAWENFYVIIGSGAAALTGLQFVVVTLIAGMEERRSGEAIAAFGSPTVVHFCSALLVAAILTAPWPTLSAAAVLLGLCGLGGVAYAVIVIRRARRQQDYQTVREDWLWYIILPLLCYITLVVTAILLIEHEIPALFGTGAATVLLIFIGIHNAWDTVTYLAVERFQQKDKSQDEGTGENPT
ncbi:MAG TPA: hypothetical protein VFU32_03500 [Ktedonobacterales bacterium]|nr:hypothetical protein [Ktedonobacterales bacterium]